MRKTNTNAKEINKKLLATSNLSDTVTQTPIEIALKIDENGMTTASNLYAFLELHPAHFSDWCKRNIKNNKFAVENEDYIVFTFESETLKLVADQRPIIKSHQILQRNYL